MSGKDIFYRSIDKILLTSVLSGASIYGVRQVTQSSDRVADELGKIQVTLAVAVSKVEDHDRRLTNLERLYLQPGR